MCYNILLSLQKLTQYIANMTTIKFLNSNDFRTGVPLSIFTHSSLSLHTPSLYCYTYSLSLTLYFKTHSSLRKHFLSLSLSLSVHSPSHYLHVHALSISLHTVPLYFSLHSPYLYLYIHTVSLSLYTLLHFRFFSDSCWIICIFVYSVFCLQC